MSIYVNFALSKLLHIYDGLQFQRNPYSEENKSIEIKINEKVL